MCQAGAPLRLVHDAVARSEAAGGIGVPAQYVAHPDDAIECRLLFDEGRSFERRQRHLCHVARCDAMRFVERLQPARLAEAVVARPACLDMDGGDDIVAGGIAQIVLRQIVLPERSEVAEPAALSRGRTQPGMSAEAKVPEMMVGIDDRPGIDIHARFSLIDWGRASSRSVRAKR